MINWGYNGTRMGRFDFHRASWNLRLIINGFATPAAIANAVSTMWAESARWHWMGFDVYLHSSSGYFRCWHDGDLIVDYSGDTLGSSPASYTDLITFGGGDGWNWGGDEVFDDIYVDDMTGESQMTYSPPDLRFDLAVPIQDKVTQWSSTNPGTPHYSQVDEIPYDNDTFIYAGTPGLTDMFMHGGLSIPGNTQLNAAIVTFRSKKNTGPGWPQIRGVVSSEGTTVYGSPQALRSDWHDGFFRLETNPANGSPWTTAAINAATVGVQSYGAFS